MAEAETEAKEKSEEIPEFVYKSLTFEEMADLLPLTNFNGLAIRNWHKSFYNECPSGKLCRQICRQMNKKADE